MQSVAWCVVTCVSAALKWTLLDKHCVCLSTWTEVYVLTFFPLMILLVHTHACRYIYAVLQEYRVRLQVQPSHCFINVCVFLVIAVFRWLFSNRQSINWTTHILQWIQTIFSDIKSAISLVYHLMTKAHHRINQRCDNNGLICIIIQASGPLVWKKKTSLKIHYKNVIKQNYILLCDCLALSPYLSIYTHIHIHIHVHTHTHTCYIVYYD